MITGNAAHSTAVDIRTAVHKGNEIVAPQISYIVAKGIEISSWVSKVKDRSAAAQMVNILHDSKLYLVILRKIINNLKVCKGAYHLSRKDSMKVNGFQKVQKTNGVEQNEGYGNMFVKNTGEFLRRSVEKFEKENILFHFEPKKIRSNFPEYSHSLV